VVMGRGAPVGHRVGGTAVPRGARRARVLRRDVRRHRGHGSLQGVQWVSGTRAPGVLGAPLWRDCEALRDRGGCSEASGDALLVQAHQLWTWWHRGREGTLHRATLRSYMTPLRREVARLVAAGRRGDMPKTAGTCRAILKRREALGTFGQVAGVEPTNHAAARAIRLGVRWRKGSIGTQRAAGARFVERMLTVVATLQQQPRKRVAGLGKGTIVIADDFDEPLPEAFWLGKA
jgi:Transposase IS66 family